MRKGLLTWVFWAEIPLGGWKGYVIDEWGSYQSSQIIVRCSVKHLMAYYLAILPLPM